MEHSFLQILVCKVMVGGEMVAETHPLLEVLVDLELLLLSIGSVVVSLEEPQKQLVVS
jgi:hypothetical protein